MASDSMMAALSADSAANVVAGGAAAGVPSPRYVRSPVYVLRLVLGAVLLAFGFVVTVDRKSVV